MNKLFKYGMVLALFAATACTDLDLSPKSTTTADVLFQDESAYRAFLARVYSGLAVTGQAGPAGAADISSLDEGFSNYLRQYWQFQELTTDEAVIAWGDEGLGDLHNHNWTDANQFVRAIYYRIFFQVSMANEFLRETTEEKLDSRGVSDATRGDIQAYRAEARFLRALSYWHGIDLLGNIPFYTEEQAIGSDAPRQATREEVFNFLDSELQAIESDIVAAGQNEYGRADRAALWMLQAKLYLNAEVYTGTDRYSDAVAATKKVIDSGIYSLEEDYDNLFLTDNDSSPELIFAIPFDGESTQTWGGMTYLIHAPVGGSMDPVDYGINGGWFGLRTTSALVDLFPSESDDIDDRANFYTDGQTKEINSISNFADGYAIVKFQNVSSEGEPGSDLDHGDADFPMFRLGDAYLMYAEAVLRGGSGGDLATAVGYINELRQRAYGDNTGNIAQADLDLDFILDERARELYWEAHRRTDLIRFNQFTENGVWPWKGNVKEGRTTEAFRNLLPIPASEILANPNLSQNQGY
ncbi:RagB/SusD family nutrient uptake outer membrane protein [Flavilitoribacter nigricans]|uniref:RagB/SusD family nutrient uptake outer membrane protein n=1 Tax=Flavilitoribacter nigricans (strain ATCC 23147 / DSM 23189 / NBRC 102662 / NCIMB 1420 / SS-2) TaxID=1122177 RepID=A0A2D0N4J3_FLAN2|nr:RagB/SusD family nutrient uptake outer membrane protein [Flavilitoribacter nigricans]PHN03424.1 RagB/SusD family nutrient uptake outer membrane protein [Flavilitoribacter nigricans DSM 23189 = NBRC 102662]